MPRSSGADDSFDRLELRAAERLQPSPPLPERLVPIERIDQSGAVRTRTFELSGQGAVNGEGMSIDRIDVTAAIDTEFWEVRNRGNTPHNVHVHDLQFQVVKYAGARLRPLWPGGGHELAVLRRLCPGSHGG